MHYSGTGKLLWHYKLHLRPGAVPIYIAQIPNHCAKSISAARPSAHEALDAALDHLATEAKKPYEERLATDDELLEEARKQCTRANRWKREYEQLKARVDGLSEEEDDEETW